MNRWLLSAAFIVAIGVTPVRAALISVENIGSILNESLPLPAEDTPGSGIAFSEYFEFSLPTRETVTVSMSDSAIGLGRVTGGVLALNDWTTTGPGPLFVPAGLLIESSPINNVTGGQEATVSPDVLAAGNYFAEISGVSGASPIHIAIDGTATATMAIPETSTWAMLALGFISLGLVSFAKRRSTLSIA